MAEQQRIPLYLPRIDESQQDGLRVLAGDVGGTKTNLAVYEVRGGAMEKLSGAVYHSADFSSCIDILKKFLAENSEAKPMRICLGVAGPVFKGKVELTNLDWVLDEKSICAATGAIEASLINDLEATAYGLAGLEDDDLITVCEGDRPIPGNMAILAPGTGLGEAGLFWDGQHYHPFPTEGGHTDFGPRTELDMRLQHWLAKKYGIVSWERVVSGPAITDIYEFLHQAEGRPEAAWLQDEMHHGNAPAVISDMAIEEKDALCMETMQIFIRYLARQSSNLVLTMKATGGLYLGGGIPPKIATLIIQKGYYDYFLDADRMQDLLRSVPIHIIRDSGTALTGAAIFGAFGPAGN